MSHATHLPSLIEQGRLIKDLKVLLDVRGIGPFVSAPLLEPRPRHFPDAWRPDALGVERLARRLLTYAGEPDMEVDVELFEGETATTTSAPGGGTRSSHGGTVAWFAGIEGRRCFFGTDVRKLSTPDLLAGIMAHEVAHAFRRLHHLEVRQRAEEEELTDLTTVYLGFGMLSTNASYRYRKSGELMGAYTRTEWSQHSGGYLSPQAMSFLLAVQVVVRDLPASARRRMAGMLEPNQAAYFKAACNAVDRDTLIERLGLPPSSEWPPVVDPSPSPFDTSHDPPVVQLPQNDQDLQRRNETLPIFRVRRTAAVRYTGLAFMLAAPACVASALIVPWWGAVGLGVVGVSAGSWLGRRRQHDRCSEPECEAVIPPEAARCPGCGGLVSGRIADANDRLEARERLEAPSDDDSDLEDQDDSADERAG